MLYEEMASLAEMFDGMASLAEVMVSLRTWRLWPRYREHGVYGRAVDVFEDVPSLAEVLGARRF